MTLVTPAAAAAALEAANIMDICAESQAALDANPHKEYIIALGTELASMYGDVLTYPGPSECGTDGVVAAQGSGDFGYFDSQLPTPVAGYDYLFRTTGAAGACAHVPFLDWSSSAPDPFAVTKYLVLIREDTPGATIDAYEAAIMAALTTYETANGRYPTPALDTAADPLYMTHEELAAELEPTHLPAGTLQSYAESLAQTHLFRYMADSTGASVTGAFFFLRTHLANGVYYLG